MKDWVEELKTNVAEKNLVLAIACNKGDLADERVVSRARAEQFARSINAIIHETSAKENFGVAELFACAPRPPPLLRSAPRARARERASGADVARLTPARARRHAHTRARARARALAAGRRRVIDLRGAEVLVDSGRPRVRVQPVVGGSGGPLARAQRAGAFSFRATRATRAPAEGRGRRSAGRARGAGLARGVARARAPVRRVPPVPPRRRGFRRRAQGRLLWIMRARERGGQRSRRVG